MNVSVSQRKIHILEMVFLGIANIFEILFILLPDSKIAREKNSVTNLLATTVCPAII